MVACIDATEVKAANASYHNNQPHGTWCLHAAVSIRHTFVHLTYENSFPQLMEENIESLEMIKNNNLSGFKCTREQYKAMQCNHYNLYHCLSYCNLTENVMSNASVPRATERGVWRWQHEQMRWKVELRAFSRLENFTYQAGGGQANKNLPHALPGCCGSHDIPLHASLSLVIGLGDNNLA